MHPNFKEPFRVMIDASEIGYGAVLMQNRAISNYLGVVCYESRQIKENEAKRISYELGVNALLFALKLWRSYMLHKKFIVYIDNRAVVYIKKRKEENINFYDGL